MHFSGGYFGGLARLGIDPTAVQVGVVATQAAGNQVQPGTCTADGGFIWDVGGFWRRLKAGETCQGTSTITGQTTVHDSTNPGGGVVVDPLNHGPITLVYDFDYSNSASSNPADAGKMLQVGPFQIPLGAQHYTIHWEGPMPADWAAFILPELAHDCSNCVFTSMQDATAGHPLGTLRDFFGDATPSKVNQDLVTRPSVGFLVNGAFQSTYTGGGNYPLAMKISLPDQPIAVVSRPDNGDQWGVYMVILPRDPTYMWDSTTNPYVLTFYWVQKPQGVWDWIKRIVGDIINGLETILCTIAPVAIKAPPTGAVTAGIVAGSVVLQMSGACTPNCPTGMNYVAAIKSCACSPGMTYDTTSKTCVMAPPAAPAIPWWVWLGGGLLVIGVLFKVSSDRKSLPASSP